MTPEAAFDAFYRASAGRVLGQVYLATGDLAAAEDAVAEAFARAWQRWPDVSRAGSPEAWVRTVASRVAISSWHKLRNRLIAHQREARRGGAGGGAVAPGLDPAHLMLVDALSTLPVRQRQAVVLHHVADLRVVDIAAELGVAEGTVKAWLSRGRAALRNELRARGFPDGDADRYADGSQTPTTARRGRPGDDGSE